MHGGADETRGEEGRGGESGGYLAWGKGSRRNGARSLVEWCGDGDLRVGGGMMRCEAREAMWCRLGLGAGCRAGRPPPRCLAIGAGRRVGARRRDCLAAAR